NILDNFSYAIGSHQLKFGVDYRRLTPTAEVPQYVLGGVFSSQAQVLSATAQLGLIVTNEPIMKPIFLNFSAYGQDSWKLSRRLTVDMGLRWDVNPAPSEANGHDAIAVTQISNLATMQF